MYLCTVDPTDTMDAYHKVLVHLMDAESVGHLMVSRELISKDDLDAITDAPSDFLKNSYLLEHVEQQLDSSGLQTFFSLLQDSGVEVNKFIGDHFLRSMSKTVYVYVCNYKQFMYYVFLNQAHAGRRLAHTLFF